MINLKLVAALAIFLPVLASPVLAQELTREHSAYAENSPNEDSDIGPLRSSSANVWAAPVGHRQPRQADIPSAAGDKRVSLFFEREDALVDSKINGICRGC